tara:strand:+ start:1688 stop:2050 length:363 start_codon:yes stop_codon:yes gene_type:complete
MRSHRFDDPRALELLGKMDVVDDPELQKIAEPGYWPAIMQMTLTSGETHISETEILRAQSPDQPGGLNGVLWSYDDVQSKFVSFCHHKLAPKIAAQIVDQVDKLDQLTDISDFVSLCASK